MKYPSSMPFKSSDQFFQIIIRIIDKFRRKRLNLWQASLDETFLFVMLRIPLNVLSMELSKEYFDQQLANVLATVASKEGIEHLDNNVRAVKSEVSQIKETLTKLGERDKEDSDAFAKTLVKHDERLTGAENDIKQLKLKSA